MQGWHENSIAQNITISLVKQEKWKQWLPLFLESYLHWAEEFSCHPCVFYSNQVCEKSFQIHAGR